MTTGYNEIYFIETVNMANLSIRALLTNYSSLKENLTSYLVMQEQEQKSEGSPGISLSQLLLGGKRNDRRMFSLTGNKCL